MKCFLLLCLLTFEVSISSAQPYQLVWSDEFNYSGLPDTSKWSYNVGGHGWGNQELQFYTAKKAKNARVENGHLIIEAHKEKMEGMNYTSARLVTKGKGDWTYGKVKVRAKLPSGLGSWPAIWMLGSKTPMQWPDDGEIDIMEHVGWDPTRVHASVHTRKYHHSINTQKTDNVLIPDFDREFHVYELEWDHETIKIGVDGIFFYTFTNEKSGREAWPFDEAQHLLLNIAVGGAWGGQKGIEDAIFPIKMEIDYVRVYQRQ